jgi:hypothetical protein
MRLAGRTVANGSVNGGRSFAKSVGCWEFASHLVDVRPVVESDAEHARWFCDREAEILVRKRLPSVRVGGQWQRRAGRLRPAARRRPGTLDWSSMTITHDAAPTPPPASASRANLIDSLLTVALNCARHGTAATRGPAQRSKRHEPVYANSFQASIDNERASRRRVICSWRTYHFQTDGEGEGAGDAGGRCAGAHHSVNRGRRPFRADRRSSAGSGRYRLSPARAP